jgi:hypothetical protein
MFTKRTLFIPVQFVQNVNNGSASKSGVDRRRIAVLENAMEFK